MHKYIIFTTFSIFLFISCGENLSTSTTDNSANVTTDLLAGTWTALCVDNSSASTSIQSILVFSNDADNLTSTSTSYSDSACVTQSYVIAKTYNTLSIGNKSTTNQNQVITKFTAVISDITLEPKTSDVATSLNADTYCGLSDWSSGTKISIAGLTCGSITFKAKNTTYNDLIQVNSGKTFIRLGNTTNIASNGYPETLYTEEYYK